MGSVMRMIFHQDFSQYCKYMHTLMPDNRNSVLAEHVPHALFKKARQGARDQRDQRSLYVAKRITVVSLVCVHIV